MIGLRRHTVRLAKHEPGWAALFASETTVIRRLLGDAIVDVEHVGSTAVPGLVAKPILDIAIAVAAPNLVPLVAERLRNAGYVDRGSAGRNGGHLLVKEAAHDIRTAHLHVVEVTAPQWDDYIRFRDTLRADDAVRRAYHNLKNELAETCRNDRQAYTAGKAAFIRGILGLDSIREAQRP